MPHALPVSCSTVAHIYHIEPAWNRVPLRIR